MKQVFDKTVKADVFKIGDMLLKWDSIYEDKGKHGKFDNPWNDPYRVFAFLGKKIIFLNKSTG